MLYMYVVKYNLNEDEKSLLDKCWTDVENSSQYLFEFGQKYIKPLKKSRDIQEKSYAIFEYFLINNQKYLSNMMTPKEYSSYSQENMDIRAINYNFRDFVAWSVFYPSEANLYYEIKDNLIKIKQAPEQRIIDKDKYKMGKKKEDGVLVDVRLKKDPDTLLLNGFTLMQKDNFLNPVIACFVDCYFLDELSKKENLEGEDSEVQKSAKKSKKIKK